MGLIDWLMGFGKDSVKYRVNIGRLNTSINATIGSKNLSIDDLYEIQDTYNKMTHYGDVGKPIYVLVHTDEDVGTFETLLDRRMETAITEKEYVKIKLDLMEKDGFTGSQMYDVLSTKNQMYEDAVSGIRNLRRSLRNGGFMSSRQFNNQ